MLGPLLRPADAVVNNDKSPAIGKPSLVVSIAYETGNSLEMRKSWIEQWNLRQERGTALISSCRSGSWICVEMRSSADSTSLPGGGVLRNPPANVVDTRRLGLIPGLGRSPGV